MAYLFKELNKYERSRPLLGRPTPSDIVRFLKHVRIQTNTGHWWWRGCFNKKDGRPQFRIGGRRGYAYTASRASYWLFNGPIPAQYDVHHVDHCRCKNCVSPYHLELLHRYKNTVDGNKHRKKKKKMIHRAIADQFGNIVVPGILPPIEDIPF